MPVPGMYVPIGANAVTRPARAFGAPQTISRCAERGFDLADLQLVGVRMLRGADDARDGERLQLLAGVLDVFDFETGHGHGLDDGVDARIGREMLFEPGEREFHWHSRRSQAVDVDTSPTLATPIEATRRVLRRLRRTLDVADVPQRTSGRHSRKQACDLKRQLTEARSACMPWQRRSSLRRPRARGSTTRIAAPMRVRITPLPAPSRAADTG